jgi:hypothetical protein
MARVRYLILGHLALSTCLLFSSAPSAGEAIRLSICLYVLWQVLTLRLFASGETKMESNAIGVIELTDVLLNLPSMLSNSLILN